MIASLTSTDSDLQHVIAMVSTSSSLKLSNIGYVQVQNIEAGNTSKENSVIFLAYLVTEM